MAKLPCEVTIGLTAEQGAALDLALLCLGASVSEYGRRAIATLLMHERFLPSPMERLAVLTRNEQQVNP